MSWPESAMSAVARATGEGLVVVRTAVRGRVWRGHWCASFFAAARDTARGVSIAAVCVCALQKCHLHAVALSAALHVLTFWCGCSGESDLWVY